MHVPGTYLVQGHARADTSQRGMSGARHQDLAFHHRYFPAVSRNPLEDAADALRALGERVRATVGDELADQLTPRRAPPEPVRSLDELRAELESLTGLETVKEQVRALLAFLQVQARRQELGLAEVATSQHLV